MVANRVFIPPPPVIGGGESDMAMLPGDDMIALLMASNELIRTYSRRILPLYARKHRYGGGIASESYEFVFDHQMSLRASRRLLLG